MNLSIDASFMEQSITDFLNNKFPGKVLGDYTYRGQFSLYVTADALYEIALALKEEAALSFDFLVDICSVDHLGKAWESEGRYEIVYTLLSLEHTYRFMLRVKIADHTVAPQSLCDIWHSANWLEREVWDMMGIEFKKHPNLTKIVTDDDLEGHPLRKDFGLVYEEPQFSHNHDEVLITPDNPNH
ncbi:MAG: NADH-quinone oxidoreductase subunit C [candidate division Zixibacteria bacterium]|nr:NADH-quinone oxidoreductase subunit C [candidate division Zixibacteria bacterium]